MGRLNFGGSPIEDKDEFQRSTILLECVSIHRNRVPRSNPCTPELLKGSGTSCTPFPSDRMQMGTAKMTQTYKRCATSRRTSEMPSWSIRSVPIFHSPQDAPLNYRPARSTESDVPQNHREPPITSFDLVSVTDWLSQDSGRAVFCFFLTQANR